MKKILTIFMAITMLFSTLMMPSYAIQFSDLDTGHWAYNNIMILVENGVVNGYTDGTYKPEKQVTRAEFFKLLMSAAYGEEEIEYFKGMFTDWALPYFYFAYLEGLLMDGTSARNLNSPITRLEMAVVLAKTSLNRNFVPTEIGDGVKFIDIAELSESEQSYINYVSKLRFINGYEDGSFKPNNYMTRAEVATVINRYLLTKTGGNV